MLYASSWGLVDACWPLGRFAAQQNLLARAVTPTALADYAATGVRSGRPETLLLEGRMGKHRQAFQSCGAARRKQQRNGLVKYLDGRAVDAIMGFHPSLQKD